MGTIQYGGLAAALLAPAVIGCNKSTKAAIHPVAVQPMPDMSVPTTPTTEAHADPPFQGEIEMAWFRGEDAKPTTVLYEIKGNRVRYEVRETGRPKAFAIADLDAHIAYGTLPGAHSYVALRVPDAGDPSRRNFNRGVWRMGTTGVIAGLRCERWRITTLSSEVEVCAARGIPYYDLPLHPIAGIHEASWAVPLTLNKAFPLRIIVRDKLGKQRYYLEARSVRPGPVDEASFEPPREMKKVASHEWEWLPSVS